MILKQLISKNIQIQHNIFGNYNVKKFAKYQKRFLKFRFIHTENDSVQSNSKREAWANRNTIYKEKWEVCFTWGTSSFFVAGTSSLLPSHTASPTSRCSTPPSDSNRFVGFVFGLGIVFVGIRLVFGNLKINLFKFVMVICETNTGNSFAIHIEQISSLGTFKTRDSVGSEFLYIIVNIYIWN